MDINITFETLYEILRREKTRPELQKLEQTFFENLVKYIQEKQAINKSQKEKTSIFNQENERTQQEIIQIRKMVKELYEKREIKILKLALSSAKTNKNPEITSMLKEEETLFNNIKSQLIQQRKAILFNILEAKAPKLQIEKPKDIKSENQDTTKLIRFIHAVPKFIAEDLNVYGPYIKEDIANLPSNSASLLVTRNKAEAIN